MDITLNSDILFINKLISLCIYSCLINKVEQKEKKFERNLYKIQIIQYRTNHSAFSFSSLNTFTFNAQHFFLSHLSITI